VVRATYAAGITSLLNPGGSKPALSALVSVDKPITFTGTPDALKADAAKTVAFVVDAANTAMSVEVPVTAAPGAFVHLAIVNDNAAVTLQDVTLEVVAPAGPDAGPVAGPDAAAPGLDAASAGPDAAAESADAGTTPPAKGCGCGSATGSPLLAGALGLIAALRRRRA